MERKRDGIGFQADVEGKRGRERRAVVVTSLL
jgi:hypothetical protein